MDRLVLLPLRLKSSRPPAWQNCAAQQRTADGCFFLLCPHLTSIRLACHFLLASHLCSAYSLTYSVAVLLLTTQGGKGSTEMAICQAASNAHEGENGKRDAIIEMRERRREVRPELQESKTHSHGWIDAERCWKFICCGIGNTDGEAFGQQNTKTVRTVSEWPF